MPVFQNGTLNTTAFPVPAPYVVIIPPSVAQLNGVPTNISGIVGTASFGPVGVPVTAATYNDVVANFGPLLARANDLGTAAAIQIQQGANNLRLVRVTDGTDVAATAKLNVVSTNYSTLLVAKYTGSYANGFTATLTQSAKANCWKFTVQAPGQVPEIYDGIAAPSASAFWVNLVAAINTGTGVTRGPSNIIVATNGTLTPTVAAINGITFSGGTDGAAFASTPTLTAGLIGTDGNAGSRTGMYALRGTGASVAMLADLSDSTSWATQVTYGLSEGTYMIMTGPSGDNIANAVTTKATAGIDSYCAKLMFGDWVVWLDTVNGGILRTVSPQAFAAGRLANLTPNLSALNRPVYAVVGTQSSQAGSTYSFADLTTLGTNGIDLITSPAAGGGNFFSCRFGYNTSSNATIHGDNYPRMTFFIANTINAGIGAYIGQINNPATQANAKASLDNYFQTLWDQNLIGTVNGSIPWRTTLGGTQSQQQAGVLQFNVQVVYGAIIEDLLVNVQGGQTVTIQSQSVTLSH